MTPAACINRLLDGLDLDHATMTEAMGAIMTGAWTPAQMAGFLIALRARGETVEEIAAAAGVMRRLATPVPVDPRLAVVDTCGTGGDGAHTFNISTTAAFVAAAAGVPVAKHGGRSVSSSCGSADVLEHLGIAVDHGPEMVARAIAELGIGFMFAPAHHGAMKHAAPVRRELGVRTLFNLLGPLTNPAGARRQVLGVFAASFVEPVARAMALLDTEHALVVHGADGLDEISLAGSTRVAEVRGAEVTVRDLDPRDYGLELIDNERIHAGNVEESARLLLSVLDGEPGPARDIVCLNAAAAIHVGGHAASLGEGLVKARAAIDSGDARARLDALVAFGR